MSALLRLRLFCHAVAVKDLPYGLVRGQPDRPEPFALERLGVPARSSRS